MVNTWDGSCRQNALHDGQRRRHPARVGHVDSDLRDGGPDLDGARRVGAVATDVGEIARRHGPNLDGGRSHDGLCTTTRVNRNIAFSPVSPLAIYFNWFSFY